MKTSPRRALLIVMVLLAGFSSGCVYSGSSVEKPAAPVVSSRAAKAEPRGLDGPTDREAPVRPAPPPLLDSARVAPREERPDLKPEGDPESDETLISELVSAHNRERAAEDRPRLVWNDRLAKAAATHAGDMAERSKMSHVGSDGSTAERRVIRAGYLYRRYGENVAYGQNSVAEVMSGWMKSSGHKKNILGNFTQIGAACAEDKAGAIYWCVVFGHPR